MNTLNLKLTGAPVNTVVELNGEQIDIRKNSFGNRVGKFTTESDTVQLKVYTPIHELSQKYWLLTSLIFFVISIFGIFDKRYGKRTFKLAYSGELKFNDGDEICLGINSFAAGRKAIECVAEGFDDNETNIYEEDLIVKKRRRILNVVKLLTWIVLAFVIIMILIKGRS